VALHTARLTGDSLAPQLHPATIPAWPPVPNDGDLTLPMWSTLRSSQRPADRIEPRRIYHAEEAMCRASDGVLDECAAGTEETGVEAWASCVSGFCGEDNAAIRQAELKYISIIG
jgi:hypothetical protein